MTQFTERHLMILLLLLLLLMILLLLLLLLMKLLLLLLLLMILLILLLLLLLLILMLLLLLLLLLLLPLLMLLLLLLHTLLRPQVRALKGAVKLRPLKGKLLAEAQAGRLDYKLYFCFCSRFENDEIAEYIKSGGEKRALVLNIESQVQDWQEQKLIKDIPSLPLSGVFVGYQNTLAGAK